MKIEEAKKLKVGDTVCDCRELHLKIVKLEKLRVYPHSRIYDVQLQLEDGSNCSAVHCCDPANHEWNHFMSGVTYE